MKRLKITKHWSVGFEIECEVLTIGFEGEHQTLFVEIGLKFPFVDTNVIKDSDTWERV